MRNLNWIAILLSMGLVAGCDSSDDPAPNTGGNGGGTGTLALAAADMPGVVPCPTQTILQDDTELAALKDALTNGTVVHLDVPFDGSDPDIFRKKCGLEGFWDPAAAVNEVAPLTTPVTIASLFQVENAGICATGFDASSFGTGEGFPAAGVYRKEFKVAHSGTTYHIRARVTVSGSSAGATFASESIDLTGTDLQNTLVYEINGTVQAHADVIAAGIAAFTASQTDAPSYKLDVRKNAADPIVFTAVVELICVTKL
jgi:hypothetical protein